MGWVFYGANYWGTSSLHNTAALCRFSTGGSPENYTPICGDSVGNYQTALADSSKWCRSDTLADWSGTKFWLGLTGSGTSFLTDSFFTVFKNKPMNRLCVEVEFPASNLAYSYRLSHQQPAQDAFAQLVNPTDAHPNLKWCGFTLGTFTSIYKSENLGICNTPEEGETFHGGGMHFYHHPTSYGRYPFDKAYAVSESTIVMCFAPAPEGVRSGMKPVYGANPLMTVVPADSFGQTMAPEYFNYITRAYVDVGGYAKTRYPVNFKINKVFALYEQNEIFAMNKSGGIMGVDLVKDSVSAYYPFIVYNWANTDRMYRPTLTAGDGPLGPPKGRVTNAHFKIFIDDNKNGSLDSNEVTEIVPSLPFELKANTDLHLILRHTPNWASGYNRQEKYGRFLWQVFFTMQEPGRLRMASYGVRTWLGTESELMKKDSILKTIEYPPNSRMLANAQWNQDKPGNGRLIKNSPDYLAALEKKAATGGAFAIRKFLKGNTRNTTIPPVVYNTSNGIVFKRIPPGYRVAIVNSAGGLVARVKVGSNGCALWGALGSRHIPPSSGVYYYLVKSPAGDLFYGGRFLLAH